MKNPEDVLNETLTPVVVSSGVTDKNKRIWMLADLSDDELLDVPLGNLKPGELARAFVVHAQHAQKVEEAELTRTRDVVLRQERTEHDEAELHQREAALLATIREREAELRIEAEKQDARAIRLADGRRAYVDGDKFRDEDGRELKGADRARAEVEFADHPDATTWQEHQSLEKQHAEIRAMRQDVEAMEQGPSDAKAAARLSGYERQLADKSAGAGGVLPDYGSADYRTALGGLIASSAAKPAAPA